MTVRRSDPWQELYLRPDAPLEVVNAAWRALAAMYHPDRAGGSTAIMARVNAARDAILTGEALRLEEPDPEYGPTFGRLAGLSWAMVDDAYLRFIMGCRTGPASDAHPYARAELERRMGSR